VEIQRCELIERLQMSRPVRPDFVEDRFRRQVDETLAKVRTILDNTRNPTYAADTAHTYDDKYTLTEFLANLGMAAEVNCLAFLGVSAEHLRTMRSWVADGQSITLRLAATETCTFAETRTREVESSKQYVEEETRRGSKTKKTHKVVTTVTEHLWNFGVAYALFAFPGSDPDSAARLELLTRDCRCQLMTTGDRIDAPKPDKRVRQPIDADLTWMAQQLGDDLQLEFKIDRTDPECRTPRRNKQTNSAIEFFTSLAHWYRQVNVYFQQNLLRVRDAASQEAGTHVDATAINDSDLLIPVAPVFEEKEPRAAGEQPVSELGAPEPAPESAPQESGALVTLLDASGAGSPMLSVGDINVFLAEQQASLQRKRATLAEVFGRADQLVSLAEAVFVVGCLHGSGVAQQTVDCIGYIEHMLREQLIAAVGKTIGPSDFAEYMEFHEKRLFKTQYTPRPFCYAIRRPNHYPDGTLAIEGAGGLPISTTVRCVSGAAPMSFALNAATRVSFTGERYLHALVATTFSGQSTCPRGLSLVARARQFSSFLLLVGKIGGADTFEPTHGIILQNKDELTIPLLLEQMPTPKEFRDAIESLSPEQQRFCKAFRAMQLEGSVFGACVIQLKPQLERLLNLAPDALTKEIRLTQDLLELFIEYQIPSDLLTYEGPADASAEEKLSAVRGHVANVRAMIDAEKEREVAEAKRKADAEIERMAAARAERMQMDMMVESCSLSAAPQAENMSYSMAMAPPGAAMGAAMRGGGPRGPPRPMAARSMQPSMKNALKKKASPQAVPAAPPAPNSVPAPAPAPAPTGPRSVNVPQQPLDTEEGMPTANEDFTLVPRQLDAKFEALDVDAALRPTTIKPSDVWTKREQTTLLGTPKTNSLPEDGQKAAKTKCFDLLDALSRSGALTVEHTTLHVMVAATHCFARSLMDTVIVDNVNPIEKLDRSALLVASTIHGVEMAELVQDRERENVSTYVMPQLTAQDSA